MAGCAHLPFMVWSLAVQVAMTARTVTRNAELKSPAACVELSNFNKAELLKVTPPDVWLTLARRDLRKEYFDLTDSLFSATRGTGGAWKCSELYRSLYILGYEEVFAAKNVSVYITKEATTSGTFWKKTIGSKIQVCFVDRVAEPDYMPPHIYNDRWKGFDFVKGSVCNGVDQCNALWEHGKGKGVYGQVYDKYPDVEADKILMSVDNLKFLEKKGLVLENLDMTARINIGERTGFSAAQVVADFKEKFFAKGVKLFYCQKSYRSETQTEWHHWFEYADIEVVGEGYTPTVDGEKVEYPQMFLSMYNECKNGDTKHLAQHIAQHERQEDWGNCGDIAGAVTRGRMSLPNCKCKAEDAKVFCGDKVVASRKFDINSVLSQEGCEKRRAYCSFKPCRPRDDRP